MTVVLPYVTSTDCLFGRWALRFVSHWPLITGNLGSGPASVRHDPTRSGSGWTLNFPIYYRESLIMFTPGVSIFICVPGGNGIKGDNINRITTIIILLCTTIIILCIKKDRSCFRGLVRPNTIMGRWAEADMASA